MYAAANPLSIGYHFPHPPPSPPIAAITEERPGATISTVAEEPLWPTCLQERSIKGLLSGLSVVIATLFLTSGCRLHSRCRWQAWLSLLSLWFEETNPVSCEHPNRCHPCCCSNQAKPPLGHLAIKVPPPRHVAGVVRAIRVAGSENQALCGSGIDVVCASCHHYLLLCHHHSRGGVLSSSVATLPPPTTVGGSFGSISRA